MIKFLKSYHFILYPRLCKKSNEINDQLYQSQLANLDEFLEFRIKSLNEIKSLKLHLTSMVNENLQVISSCECSMFDIADRSYLQEVGTDSKIVGGVGIKLNNLKTTDLSKSKAIIVQKATNNNQNYKFTSFNIDGKDYFAFKISTISKNVSSNFEYILDSKENKELTTASGKENDLPLHILAASDNNEALTNLLVKEPETIDVKNVYGYTPLMIAVQNGDMALVKNLLAKGSDVNMPLPSGINSLSLAILNGNQELAVHLINATNININNENTNKNTALHYAIDLKFNDIAQKLIEKGANLNVARNEDGYYPFHIAAKLGNDYIIEAIKNCSQFDCNTQIASGKSALHIAAAFGRLTTVKFLLKHGINVNLPDTNQDNALMEALNHGQIRVAYHLANICQINATNKMHQTSSLIAAKLNQFDIADKLIERGENPLENDTEGHNYIYYLLTKGEYQRYIELHNKLKFDINMSFPEGLSLFIAANSGKHLLSNYLIEKGAKFFLNDDQHNLRLLSKLTIFLI